MLKWIIIPVLIFGSVSTSYCQRIILQSRQDTVDRLTALISSDQLLSSPTVSIGARPSKPFYRFIYLLSICDDKDLLDMVKDTTRYLRIYGYMGLLHLNHPNLKKVKKTLLADTALIATIAGCNFERMPVAKAVKEIKWWYYKKGFEMLMQESKAQEYSRGFAISDLLVE